MLTRQPTYWLARITDPPSGFVSLRATVTDRQGDSAAEVIHRAYGITAPVGPPGAPNKQVSDYVGFGQARARTR